MRIISLAIAASPAKKDAMIYPRLFFITLTMLMVSACFESKAPFSSDNGPTPDPSEVTFPHPKGYASPQSHGGELKALAFDPTACKACHGANLDGGSGPACATCHNQYPHPDGWVAPNQHGAFVSTNGVTSCATKCHNTDLSGGLSEVACVNCHQPYPHSPNWKDPIEHGLFVKNIFNFSTSDCLKCHSGDPTAKAVACSTCHALYPHPAGWETADQHGAFAKTSGTNQCATFCHGTDLAGGNSGVACNSCHEVYPHPEAWATTALHGETMRKMGNTACTGCHTLSSDPTSVCAKCHASLPSHYSDPNWASSDHGSYTLSLADKEQSCTLCHGATLAGGAPSSLAGVDPEPACNACHASYPIAHRQPTWLTNATTEYPDHGKAVIKLAGQKLPDKGKDDFNTTVYANCAPCHGNLLSIDPSINGIPESAKSISVGNTSVPTCYNCHLYPHPSTTQTINGKTSVTRWRDGHIPLLISWSTLAGQPAELSKATCGLNNQGCHVSGPKSTTALSPTTVIFGGCDYCHPVK